MTSWTAFCGRICPTARIAVRSSASLRATAASGATSNCSQSTAIGTTDVFAQAEALQVLVVAHERADLGLRLPREEVAAHPCRPEHALQLEAVVPNRVAVRDDGMELMRDAKWGGHRDVIA